MAIFNKAKQYKKFILDNSFSTPETRRLVSAISRNFMICNIIIGIVGLWILFCFVAMFSVGGSAILMGIFGGIVLFLPIIPFGILADKNVKKLDNLIFKDFLNERVVSFASIEEANRYDYEEGDRINRVIEISSGDNLNKIIIELSAECFIRKADGFIITNQNKHNVEALLINNIKKKESSEDIKIDSKKDLKYWFELKEKGAVTEEEFNKKKSELL